MSIFLRWIRPAALLLFAAALARAGSLEDGARAFAARDFDRAREIFSTELARSPGDVLTSLWLGLAVHATGGPFAGADEWRVATGNPRYEPMAKFFRGLSNWQAGYANDARAYFNDAQVNVTDGKPVNYPPARKALADLAAGRPVPAVETWPALAGLPASHAPVAPAAQPAPTAPVAPAIPRVVAQAPVPPRVVAPVGGYRQWEAAGIHRVGDRVLFRAINGEWRAGIVEEVGTAGTFRDKYLVAQADRPLSKDYYYYMDVSGPDREEFWTAFFIGEWGLGSGMSVSEKKEGTERRNEYLYVGSSEALVIKTDGTYTWSTPNQPTRSGRWQPHPTAPGIILQRGVRDRDYDIFNITDPAAVGVMKEHHIRLQTPGIQSTLGRRKIP